MQNAGRVATVGLVARALATLAVAGSLAACGAALPPVPGKGGPAWTELTSDHFILWTDASAKRGKKLLIEMEHLRQVVYGMAFADAPPEGRTFAVALRDSYEVGEFVPSQFIAFASWNEFLRLPMIVFAADTDDSDGHVIAHELTHMISRNAIHHQPAWFAEGLAQFFETVQLDTDRAVIDVGDPLPDMLAGLRYQHLKHAAEVMACKHDDCKDSRFYTTTWAIYAFLANTRGEDLLRFQAHLDDLPDDPAKAWSDVFPDLPPAALDRALLAWLLHGRRTTWHFKVDLAEPTIASRTITDDDVYAVRALLRYEWKPKAPQIARDVADALAIDPTNTLARSIAVALGQPPTVDEARAMTTAHPDDWRSWWLLANTLGREGDEAHAALRQVCTLAAVNPAVWSPWICDS